MMKDCDKCLHKRSLRNGAKCSGLTLFGYGQRSMKSRSRSANNTSIAEIMS